MENDDNEGKLSAKAQLAMSRAAALSKHHLEDDDEEMEAKSKKLKSGLLLKTAPKVKVEVDWFHHNLGTNPIEVQTRVNLMNKIAYWSFKNEWNMARSIYAAVL